MGRQAEENGVTDVLILQPARMPGWCGHGMAPRPVRFPFYRSCCLRLLFVELQIVIRIPPCSTGLSLNSAYFGCLSFQHSDSTVPMIFAASPRQSVWYARSACPYGPNAQLMMVLNWAAEFNPAAPSKPRRWRAPCQSSVTRPRRVNHQ
jgi:hypothetical protein